MATKTTAEVTAMAKHYSKLTGRAVNNDEMIGHIAGFDEVAATTAASANYTTVIWDKTSPINGVAAADILASRKDIPEGGEVYLIMRGDQVMIFQPHPPDAPGLTKMTKDMATTSAAKQKKHHVDSDVGGKLTQHLLQKLNIDVNLVRTNKAVEDEINRRVQLEVARILSEARTT